jgi:predicted transcriptional regulator
MRPIVSKQDPVQYPLNELFGTWAHVRLLRVMANEVEGPLTTVDVAMRAGLTVTGAQKALEKLLLSGFVSRVGGGRKYQYEIRRSEGLIQIILAMFQAEKERYEQIVATIKKQIVLLTPPPQAAWIQVAPREIGEPLILGVLHGSRHLTESVRQLRALLYQVEKNFDLTIEVEGYTRADLPQLTLGEVAILYGVLPQTPAGPPHRPGKNGPAHHAKDRQLSVLSQRVANILEKDASLVRRAKEHIARLLKEDQGAATKDIAEWRDILDNYSIQRLIRFLTSSHERATRLRQSNPFLPVLNASERAQVKAE